MGSGGWRGRVGERGNNKHEIELDKRRELQSDWSLGCMVSIPSMHAPYIVLANLSTPSAAGLANRRVSSGARG